MAAKTKTPALTEIPDFNGTPVRAGDKVVYIYKTYCTAELRFGIVSGLSKVFGMECAVIKGKSGYIEAKPTSRSIFKVG